MMSVEWFCRFCPSMRAITQVSREVPTPLDDAFFQHVAEETFRQCSSSLTAGKEEITLNVVAVSPERIRELNQTYRSKDAETDILSFSEYTDTVAFQSDKRPHVFLGEIFFCQEVIAAAAEEDEVTGAHEMTYVFSHGVLHLLGYDHSDEMFRIQDTVTESLMKQSRAEVQK